MIDGKSTATSRRGRPAVSADDRRQRIACLERAVIDCLATRRSAEVSLEDIVRAAGVSRRTFYRFFESRGELFAHVLGARAVAIAAEVARFTDACEDFPDAIVEGTMETLGLVSNDPVFKALADANTMLRIMRQVPEGEGEELFMVTWKKVFARGRDSGLLRREISDRQAADWLHSIHYLLALRTDLSDAAKRAMLIDFVVPSLVTGGLQAGEKLEMTERLSSAQRMLPLGALNSERHDVGAALSVLRSGDAGGRG